MNLNTVNIRAFDSNEWALALFVFAFFLLAVAKATYEKRFFEFYKLGFSNKYIKVYRDNSNLLTSFTICIFFANLFSVAFLIHLCAAHFGYSTSHFGYQFVKNDWVMFIRIFTLLTIFVMVKYLIEKIVITLFGVEDLFDQFNLQKISYKSYIGLIFLPVGLILFFGKELNDSFYYYAIGSFVVINLIYYLIILRNFQKIIFSKLFYFILYLCTLEIGPYYFIYNLIKKN